MTVAHRNDIQRAMSEAVEAASRGAGARGQLTQQSLPPIRLQVVKVASEVSREGTQRRLLPLMGPLNMAGGCWAERRAAADSLMLARWCGGA